MSMEHLKVTAHLQSGIVSDATLPLDGVLFSLVMRDHYGPELVTVPGAYTAEPVSMPVAIVGAGRADWFYACSWAQWNKPVAEYTDFWVKRFDAERVAALNPTALRGKLTIGSGRYRGYHMPKFTRHALTVWWYLTAERAWVERLLPHVTHLGKKPAQGDGRVLRWLVELCAADYSLRGPGGQLMRAVPVTAPEAAGVAGAAVYCGYRPSYWLRANQAECRGPT